MPVRKLSNVSQPGRKLGFFLSAIRRALRAGAAVQGARAEPVRIGIPAQWRPAASR